MDEKACKYCSNIGKLNNNTFDRVKNLNKKNMLKNYISLSQPVILEDGMKNWDLPSLDMEILSNVFLFLKTYIIIHIVEARHAPYNSHTI